MVQFIKFTFTLFLAISLPTTINAQRKLKKLDVKEEGLNISTRYQPVKERIDYKGLSIKITPVSADNLNAKFNFISNLSGKFNYSFYEKSRESYFLKKQRKRAEKSDFEFLIEGLDWLQDTEKITENEYNEFFSLIYRTFISDSILELTQEERNVLSNPFYIGSNYMSVFKIEFFNSTNSAINFTDTLFIKSGDELLPVLDSDFLRQQIASQGQLSLNKTLILERFNLDSPLEIPANSNITKYFSTLPLHLDSDVLNIYLKNSNQFFSWKVERTQNVIQKEYSFYELALAPLGGNGLTPLYNFFILSDKSKNIAYLGEKKIFVSTDNADDLIEILCLSMTNENLYYYRMSDLKATDYIDLARLKRSTITFVAEKLTEVKRKN